MKIEVIAIDPPTKPVVHIFPALYVNKLGCIVLFVEDQKGTCVVQGATTNTVGYFSGSWVSVTRGDVWTRAEPTKGILISNTE